MHPEVITEERERMLPLSGIQHFAFCRRQWALIHLEGQWAENLRTVEGALMHSRAHEEGLRERRGDVLTIRGLAVYSRRLGLSGKCDVAEFHACSTGVPLQGEDGLWLPFPVEYKRGVQKSEDADRLQLCAQAMCLEEMLCCDVPQGALYYGETHRRELVPFTPELRGQVGSMTMEMHDYARRGYTPRVKPRRGCAACSLKELCLPALKRAPSAAAYLHERVCREEGP